MKVHELNATGQWVKIKHKFLHSLRLWAINSQLWVYLSDHRSYIFLKGWHTQQLAKEHLSSFGTNDDFWKPPIDLLCLFYAMGHRNLKLHLNKLHLEYLHCIHIKVCTTAVHHSIFHKHLVQASTSWIHRAKSIILHWLSCRSLLQVWFQRSSTFWFTGPWQTDPETLVQCQKSMSLYCCMTKQFAKGDCNYTVVFFFSWLPARELLVIIHVMQCHSVSDSWVKPQHCGLVV